MSFGFGVGDFVTPTTTTGGTMDFGIQNRRPNEQIYSIAGGAKHLARSWLVDYDLSASHARQDRLDQSTVMFGSGAGPRLVSVCNSR
jgi:hypothetical protein